MIFSEILRYYLGVFTDSYNFVECDLGLIRNDSVSGNLVVTRVCLRDLLVFQNVCLI